MPRYRALINCNFGPADVLLAGDTVEVPAGMLTPTIQAAIGAGWLVPEPSVPAQPQPQPSEDIYVPSTEDRLDAAFGASWLDDNLRDSDWADIYDLLENMRHYAQDNPNATFLCADDPGQGVRVPRLGWSAYEQTGPEVRDEKSKNWTITLVNFRMTCHRNPVDSSVSTLLSSSTNRQEHLVNLVRSAMAVSRPRPKTVWERLEED